MTRGDSSTSAAAGKRKRKPSPVQQSDYASDSSSDLPESIFPIVKKRAAATKNDTRQSAQTATSGTSTKGGTKSQSNKRLRPRRSVVRLGHVTLDSDGEDVEELERWKSAKKRRGNPLVVDLCGAPIPPARSRQVRTREESGAIVIMSSDEEDCLPKSSQTTYSSKFTTPPPSSIASSRGDDVLPAESDSGPSTHPIPEPISPPPETKPEMDDMVFTFGSDALPSVQGISKPCSPGELAPLPDETFEPGQLQTIYDDALKRSLERHRTKPLLALRRKHRVFQSLDPEGVIPPFRVPITYSTTFTVSSIPLNTLCFFSRSVPGRIGGKFLPGVLDGGGTPPPAPPEPSPPPYRSDNDDPMHDLDEFERDPNNDIPTSSLGLTASSPTNSNCSVTPKVPDALPAAGEAVGAVTFPGEPATGTTEEEKPAEDHRLSIEEHRHAILEAHIQTFKADKKKTSLRDVLMGMYVVVEAAGLGVGCGASARSPTAVKEESGSATSSTSSSSFSSPTSFSSRSSTSTMPSEREDLLYDSDAICADFELEYPE